jgi:1-acyl-sn-glycerol-3-phosphate acyltransferase
MHSVDPASTSDHFNQETDLMSTSVSASKPRRPWGYSRFWRSVSVIVLRPSLRLLIRNRWRGQSNIPKSGGVILAPNHMSYADWGTDALFIYEAGRYPVFLIKSGAFEIKGIGPFLHKAGQLPVYRGRADAALVLKDAEQALNKGACVVIYPESTATRDPDLWPMVAKTGVARLALTANVPVIPVARWGTQHVLPYGSKKVHLFPRKTVTTIAGPPVDLSPWAGKQGSARALREATAAIMSDVAGLLGQLRGEEPPAALFDPAAAAAAKPDGAPGVAPGVETEKRAL